MNKKSFMQKLEDIMNPPDLRDLVVTPKFTTFDDFEGFDNMEVEDEDDELVIDLKFIVEECPPIRIVREFMMENIKSVNEDDPFFIMLEEQI